MANPVAVVMEKELYVAATKGNVGFLLRKDDGYLLKRTHKQNNIIHIAIRHKQINFIEACFIRFTKNELICANAKGNNPLHVAAEMGNMDILSLMYKYIEERIEEIEGEKPWRVQNLKGNTPLHVAIIHDNVEIARFLLEKDPSLACTLNNSSEAPLHLAIKQHANYSESELIIAKVKQPIQDGGAALPIEFPAQQGDMSSIIELLVEKANFVACWPDIKGLTPLHRAASLITPYNLKFTRLMLEHCPQSAEVCEINSGKSILHLLINKIPSYQECKQLVELEEIFALRNKQDKDGNTPLHFAAKNMDINMVRVLLESSTKLTINNTEGVSPASIIQQKNVLQLLRKRKMNKEELNATERADIPFLRERVRKLGIDFLHSQDPKGRNILHILMHIKNESRILKYEFLNFIEEVLAKFPSLLCQTEQKGDTPIHVLVQNKPDTRIYIASRDQFIAQNNGDNGNDYNESILGKSDLLSLLLEQFNVCVRKVQKEASNKGRDYNSPWLMQNEKLNTPLHEALIAEYNSQLVMRLLNYDKKSAHLANKCKETPLHLLARLPTWKVHYSNEDIETMVKADAEAAFQLDQDRLTPLLRAFKSGNIFTGATLCSLSPEAAKIRDGNGYTFWHYVVNHPSNYYVFRLIKQEAFRDMLRFKDNNGDTLLHLAIRGNRFDLVKEFLDIWVEKDQKKENKDSSNGKKDKWLVELLNIDNKAGKTPADLIAESACLPSNIEKGILGETEMIGVLSVWGIPSREMKTYVNTIGIIAALLTTITFTAAFTVPGGIIQDNNGILGTPVLIEKVAFQIFMISDIIAMCLSMMVLCCLLWVMATSKRHNSVMILDFSLSLLIASFFATLVTFMTGLYATTFPVKPWIAIITLVLCSVLMLLVHKFIVTKLLIPFRNAINVFFTWKFLQSVTGLPTKTNTSNNPGVTSKENITRPGPRINA